jgi:hypothetical protein
MPSNAKSMSSRPDSLSQCGRCGEVGEKDGLRLGEGSWLNEFGVIERLEITCARDTYLTPVRIALAPYLNLELGKVTHQYRPLAGRQYFKSAYIVECVVNNPSFHSDSTCNSDRCPTTTMCYTSAEPRYVGQRHAERAPRAPCEAAETNVILLSLSPERILVSRVFSPLAYQ